MVYANGDEEDEKVHLKKHNMKAQGVDTKVNSIYFSEHSDLFTFVLLKDNNSKQIHPFFDSVAGHFQSYSCNVQVNINSVSG